MPSLFMRIVNGEIPAHKITEDEQFLAFLDIFPLAEGHTLVIPKQEIDYLFDLPEALYTGLFSFARKLATPIQRACPCLRVGLAVLGLEVPHAHIHLIPLNSLEDINFSKPKLKPSQEELSRTALRIKGNM
jgi:histidine triad (HIT) family protein